ncbi:uncharacterized protein [Pyxicephalus adspersus]|uniref:uncharacterized protein isoform X2 n=1 Tax=Pyxicephalus adspersus TaxID=30357 RepID=UPI003B5B5435
MPHLFLYVSIVHGEVLKPQLCLAVQTSQDKMTVYFFICWCLVIYLPRLSQSCDSIKSLSFEEGKDVILNLNLSIPVTAVTWNYKKHIIAITKPGQPVKMGEFASDYTGRLGSSTKDGSLSIRALSSKDIRVYRAELFTSEKYICAQLFDLKISGDLGLSPRIVEAIESCGPTIQLYRRLGENVILQLPSLQGVELIYWDINNIDHIAITKPNGILEHPSYRFAGRLSALSDGSLKLTQITKNEENVFRAEIFIRSWVHYGTHCFDVKIKANKYLPSTPSTEQTKPSMTAKLGRNTTSAGMYTLWNGIHLALSAFVLILAVCILVYHCRTECSTNM